MLFFFLNVFVDLQRIFHWNICTSKAIVEKTLVDSNCLCHSTEKNADKMLIARCLELIKTTDKKWFCLEETSLLLISSCLFKSKSPITKQIQMQLFTFRQIGLSARETVSWCFRLCFHGAWKIETISFDFFVFNQPCTSLSNMQVYLTYVKVKFNRLWTIDISHKSCQQTIEYVRTILLSSILLSDLEHFFLVVQISYNNNNLRAKSSYPRQSNATDYFASKSLMDWRKINVNSLSTSRSTSNRYANHFQQHAKDNFVYWPLEKIYKHKSKDSRLYTHRNYVSLLIL